MRLVDANVLIYAVNESEPHHDRSRAWLDAALVGSETVGFTWVVLLAFLRLTTRVGLFPQPLSVGAATDRVRAWLAQPAAVIVEPGPRHGEVLSDLLLAVGAGGNLVSDAHLAALAIEQHAEIVTFDTDFIRFAGVSAGPPDRG